MSVDETTVRRIAALARIAIGDAALAPMARELERILAFVGELDKVDTADVPPMLKVNAEPLKRRADEVTDGGFPEAVLANAPQAEDGFFTVPKVVE